MVKRSFALLGLAEALFPGRIIDVGERLAFESRGGATLRPWTVPVARAEGVAFLALGLTGRLIRPGLRLPLGLVGAAMVLFPGAVVGAALRTAYRNAAGIELRPWVVPATRALGAAYVAAALLGGSGRGSPEAERPARDRR